MRQKFAKTFLPFKIAIIDDEIGIIDSVSVALSRHGYNTIGYTDPIKAIEEIKKEPVDLIVLDYLMDKVNGDQVVEQLRKFNPDVYILLLTGHRNLAPPYETLDRLDIQGYCEKSDNLDQLILLVKSGIKSVEQMMTIKKYKNGLSKILQIVPKIYKLSPIDGILDEILNGIMNLCGSEDAFLLIDDINEKPTENKSIVRGIGRFDVDIDTFLDLLEPEFIEHIGFIRAEHKPLIIEKQVFFPFLDESGHCIGVLYIESFVDQNVLEIIEIFAKQSATSINNAFLHSLVNIRNEELEETYEELKKSYMDTIEVLRLAVDAKDCYTSGHSDRVSYYAVNIGKKLELDLVEIENLRLGGIFHDIGKIGTSDSLLVKKEVYDLAEYDEMKKHPTKGAHILSAVSMFKGIVPLIKSHHERVDGQGYPDGLCGEEIPYLSRILSVADTFDAMTSNRLYRKNLEINEAIEQLQNAAGTQLEPNIVDAFIRILETDTEVQNQIKKFIEV